MFAGSRTLLWTSERDGNLANYFKCYRREIKKMSEDFSTEEKCLLCRAFNARMHAAASGLKAPVDILAKNRVPTSLCQDKLDCHVFWTLGWYHITRMETCSVFLLMFFFSFFPHVGVHGHCRNQLGGSLSLRETPERLGRPTSPLQITPQVLKLTFWNWRESEDIFFT